MFSIFKILKKKKLIPHIRLSGIIGSVGRFKQGINFASQQEIIDKAFSMKKTLAIAISINSPGGSPVQSHLIYSYIKKLAKRNNKKVLVFAEDVAASGGYLIACAGDEIYANSSSIVGSIGVISSSFGFQNAIKKIGIERRVYTAGQNKSTLDPFKEENEEDVKRLKKIQLELHADFINVVKKSRASKLVDTEKNNTFTGEFWSGSTSLKLGLIDGIGNAEQILREKFGEEIVIKKLEKPKGFLAKKLSASLENQVDSIASLLEERVQWQKFGL
jgi:signal peptide peptidase SppA